MDAPIQPACSPSRGPRSVPEQFLCKVPSLRRDYCERVCVGHPFGCNTSQRLLLVLSFGFIHGSPAAHYGRPKLAPDYMIIVVVGALFLKIAKTG